MNGYLRGRLTDDEGAAELIKTARETAQVGKWLGVANTLNAIGYRGPIGLEAFASGDADAALEFFRDTFAVLSFLVESETAYVTLPQVCRANKDPSGYVCAQVVKQGNSMAANRLGFVGTGAITCAIVKGLATSGLKGWPIIVSPRSRERAEDLAAGVASVSVALDNQAVVDQSDIVFLAVRPQIAPEVVRSLRFRDGQTVISLVAGMQASAIAALIECPVDIVRAIPLPSVEQRACVTPIMPPNREAAMVFSALGSTIEISDPAVFDGYVAGSAVMATYFGFVKAAVDWLHRNGLNENDADLYLRNLFGNLGDIMRAKPELSLEELRADHTTIGGLNEMVHLHFTKNGGPEALESGLDAVLARVRAQSNS